MKREQRAWPPEARDYPGTRRMAVKQEILYQRQFKDPDGPWLDKDMPLADRDRMTLNTAYGLNVEPDVRWRVLRIDIRVFVDEVIGDGKGETSTADLLARTEKITEALKKADGKRNPFA